MKAVDLNDNFINQVLHPYEDEGDELELSKSDSEEIELSRLPKNALEIARFEDLISHSPGLTWNLSCTYFAVSVPGQSGTFALLALNWDDNWERWEWELHGGVSNSPSISDAAKFFKPVIEARHST